MPNTCFLKQLKFTCAIVAPPLPPSAVNLNTPAQNTVCLAGEVVSATLSSVTFKWNSSVTTNSYDVVIKDRVTSTITTNNTTQTLLTVNVKEYTIFMACSLKIEFDECYRGK